MLERLTPLSRRSWTLGDITRLLAMKEMFRLRQESGSSGDHVDYVGRGGTFGAEEQELGEEDFVGVAEENATLPFDDGVDLRDGEAMRGEEGYDGVGPLRILETEVAGGGEGGFRGEAAGGDEVGDNEGVRVGNGGEIEIENS
ncbi:uncharacterized protein HKW66_Vig0020270 [Vigna angularis]|uniref:Uncharacterized protein n=1 Tax=Phaseolus angularis TaxID=3914 RepID=A0A8T0LAZ9_PHAAN|nr:uncharacterized protein HKW66_Vig0020270 [Vigna angularis]